jgi:poly(beta-D-mannuronate) lyase
VFALAPLVLLAEIAMVNNIPLYEENHGALHRLAESVIAGIERPETFEMLVHAPQQFTLPPDKSHLAWGEAYNARFHDAKLESWLSTSRPLVDMRLGGDQTLAFRPTPPSRSSTE